MTFGATFLRRPDAFPGASEGDAWGEGSVALAFAGGPYVFSGLSHAQVAAARQRFRGFLVEPVARAPVSCHVRRSSTDAFTRFDLRGFELTLDSRHASRSVETAGVDLMARLSWGESLEATLWTPSEGGPWFAGVLENLFRMLVAYRVVELGGLLLHSAALARGDGAWVFPGRSGAGKSTLAALGAAQGGLVLSDDLNALVPSDDDDAFRVEGVPFAGDLRAEGPESRRLEGLALLRQGAASRFAQVTRAEALSGVLSCAPYVNQDPHRLEALGANVERLLAARPCGRLTFALDAAVWDTMDAARAVA